MSDESGHMPFSPAWVASGILGIMTLLASLVAMFYKKVESENTKAIAKLELTNVKLEETIKHLEKKSDDCEADRLGLHKLCARHEAKIAVLEELTKDLVPVLKSLKPT